ncbi:hypothetical protein RJ640_029567 [Escallonia rubra]|uniref:Peptidyl-prolyl cis-trans isomerase n=1 Tax=Escallonia rubra TaxID=112253 RepID=A0AA88RHM1_9ASTE|nr:hypothetical protein RJ640_029567 [Escallonia rubra]
MCGELEQGSNGREEEPRRRRLEKRQRGGAQATATGQVLTATRERDGLPARSFVRLALFIVLIRFMARIKPQALLQQSKKKKGPSRVSMTTILLYSLIVVVMVFFLFSTYRHWSQRSRLQTEDRSVLEGDDFTDMKRPEVPRYAVFNTSKGLITVELYKEGSPEVVDEFIDSCQNGHFRGMLFHRVIKHFVIQGGDVESHEAAEYWTSRGKHYNQLSTSLKHEAFMLGTSKEKHDSVGFKLFITTAPIPDLNEKVNVFGRVIKGEDVVQEIEEVDTDEHYRPKSPIGIINVTLKQKI